MKLLTTVALLLVFATPAAAAPGEPGPTKKEVAKVVKRVKAPKVAQCRSAMVGAVYYRLRHDSWRELMGASVKTPSVVPPAGCAHARYRVEVWRARAAKARSAYLAYKRWLAERTLRDFAVRPGNDAWRKSVYEVQRVFPGTASWLLSCSGAEGGHGRWVIYGGRSYFPGAEYTYNGHLPQVGGPMQFMWGTFKGMYRRGLEYVLSKGYLVPDAIRDHSNVRAWRSMLAQAIAAGWARYTGNDDSHWSASWGSGC